MVNAIGILQLKDQCAVLTARIKLLLTGKAEWCDPETGEVTDRETLDLRTRWAIAGIHSCNWRWVRRFGKRECGCVINPITRRTVLYDMECSVHGLRSFQKG